MINQYDFLAVTLLDALEGIDPIKICTDYLYEGEPLKTWPIQSETIKECTPKYIEMPGWESRSSDEWSKIAEQGYDALPEEVKNYQDKLEEIFGCEIRIISIGPNRSDTIIKKEIW